MELWDELRSEQDLLDKAVRELKPRGRDLAEKEHAYRVALSKRMLVRRTEGFPATLISDIVRGEEDIAQLRMQRDIAESLHQSALESINVLKLKIRILNEQLAREWGAAK